MPRAKKARREQVEKPSVVDASGEAAELVLSARANPAEQKGYLPCVAPSAVARGRLWTYLQQMDRFQIRGRGATYPHADSGGARHETADSHHQEVVSCTRFAFL